MEKFILKNDYVLKELKKCYLPDQDLYYYDCIYTNGLKEIDIQYTCGETIKTVLVYERLD